MGRRFALLLVGALSAAMPLIVSPSASAAQSVDLTCTGSMTARFSPGVTFASVNQTVTADIRGGSDFQPDFGCTSVNGIAYEGVTGTVNLTGKVSCIVGRLDGTALLKWDNGDVSTASVQVTTIGPVPLIDARITSGALTGSRLALLGAPVGLTGLCVTPITRLSAVGVATFLKL